MRWRAVLASWMLLVAACVGSSDDGGDRHEIVVLAAASLAGAFTEIGVSFEAQNPGASVLFSFGSSDGLAAQIADGARADVFASASPAWMDAVEDEPGVTGRADFARNRMAIVTPIDDPAGIAGIQDLGRPGVKLVIAAEGVPAGDYARQVLEAAGISRSALANVVSNEQDVKGVVTKVLTGEADAGIAYVTDVTGEVALYLRLVAIPEDVNVIATYPIAVVNGSKEADLAERFLDYVLGQGQGILARYGFLPAA